MLTSARSPCTLWSVLETYEALRIVNWVEAHQDIGCTAAVLALCGTNEAIWVENLQWLRDLAADAPEAVVEGFCESCRMVWTLQSDRPRRIMGVIFKR